ncbi:MAG: glycosyltransferase family 4 protein [Planctomycetota bacterium]
MSKNVVVLVPNWNGGIDRLFENINQAEHSEFKISMFNTHGRSLLGLSFLPFKLVYYTSAVLYTLILPFRLLAFALLCAFGRVDVCHVNLSTGASTIRKALFALVCRLFRVPYVVHLHGGDYRRFFAGLPRPLQSMARSLYLNAERVIVLGAVWKQYVEQEIGVLQSKTQILPNAVAGPANFESSDKLSPPRIVFLGRLIKAKGIEELIDALSSPQVASLSWTAVLAGDGEVAKYRDRIDAKGLSDRIELPGWVTGDAVDAALRTSSIFALPSHHENLPLSMLEAMAYGLCCIVTPVGSVEDVIQDSENGLVISVGDSAGLTRALLSVLQDKDLRDRLGLNAREDFLKQYDYKDYRGKLEAIYRSVLHVGN